MNNNIREKAKSTVKDVAGLKAVLYELENVLYDLDASNAVKFPENVSVRLEKIERHIKRIEEHVGRDVASNPSFDKKIEKISNSQINMYRNTIFKALSEVCSNILVHSREIERLNAVIAKLPAASGGELEMRRLLSNIDDYDGKVLISRREREVLVQLLRGKTNREISNELGISEKTVKNHLWRIYRKLGVENRTQLFHKLIST